MKQQKSAYGKILRVEEDSPAYDAGIRAGDELVSIGGRRILDILDYSYYSSDKRVALRIKRNHTFLDVVISNPYGDDLGIEFEEDLFDGVRHCTNDCIFCFLKQMPPGMRDTLYVRDDDFRLSFAQGNYITLTNLSDDDLERIISQRMGPLYISVHTTDPDLRVEMMGNRSAGRIMDQLKALATAGITMHTQMVLCPGINDGAYLEKSIRDLGDLYPWVESIAVVPVGITRYRTRLPVLRQYSQSEADGIISTVVKWQREFRKRCGSRLVYASDEFYLRAGVKIPGRAVYEGFPQYENGVGICRYFMDELRIAKNRLKKTRLSYNKYILITGMLAADNVRCLADVLTNTGMVEARAYPIVNKFFGETVTVAGLLTGHDIIDELQKLSSDEIILVPDVALNDNRFLDDITISDLQKQLGKWIVPVSVSPIELISQLREIS